MQILQKSWEAKFEEAWKICQKLRGSMDGYEMKNYIFSMIFYKYFSDSFTKWFNKSEHDAGDIFFDYSKWTDEEAKPWKQDSINKRGYYIRPTHLFNNLYKSVQRQQNNEKKLENLDITLNSIFGAIERSSDKSKSCKNLQNLLTSIKWNDNKLGTEPIDRWNRILDIMEGVAKMTLLDAREQGSDFLGSLYEFLMGKYASSSGKKAGEFYTPPEVSELLTRIVIEGKNYIKSAYDPTCGSGSLLLKFNKLLGKNNYLKLCGQEKNIATYNLCRMNMFIHNINYSKFHIEHGDTLERPSTNLQTEKFDAIVANPPYSLEWDATNIKFSKDPRFASIGVLPPKRFADFAFVLHSLYYLSTTGKAAILIPIGALTRSGAEQKIRKWLIDRNYIDTIILLPSDIFFGTRIFTAILVLCKNKKDNKVLFINGENEYIKTRNTSKKILSRENIEKIMNIYKSRENIEFTSSLVTKEEIDNNQYTLNVDLYINHPKTKEEIDISSLNEEINKTVQRINVLRENIETIIQTIQTEKK